MSDSTGPGPVARFFGGLLMAVGGLIAVTAGLCSLTVTVIGIAAVWDQPGQLGSTLSEGLPMVLISGGIPLGVGIGLILLGRFLYRGPKRSSTPPGPVS